MSLTEIPDADMDTGNTKAGASHEREQLQAVYRCVCRLPKVDCALALLYLNGLRYEEMAEILGMSTTNVGVRLSRIRGTLAEMMKGYDDEL